MRVDPDSFEQPYARDGDPWSFETSPYEQLRYATTIEMIGGRHERCFEPASSIGVLTERLAELCDEVVTVDPSPSAVGTARRRLDGLAHVHTHVGALPEWWPTGTFDLVVLSEIGYYFDREELTDLVGRVAGLQRTPGDLVAVHWLGRSPDHLLHGSEVHDVLDEVLGEPDELRRHDSFVAAAWRR